MPTNVPPPEALAAILGPGAQLTSHVDIYEEDGTTLWMPNAPLVTGDISVDSTRDERRHIEATFRNEGGALDNYPGGFWYDKVIKPYRGVRYIVRSNVDSTLFAGGVDIDGGTPTATGPGDVGGGAPSTEFTDTVDGGPAVPGDILPFPYVILHWETQCGEFLIDEIRSPSFPQLVQVKGRDFTVKLTEDKLARSTTFDAGSAIETVIRALAVNGGITKMILPETGHTLGKDYSFEAGTSRWDAMTKIATAFGYELFFDAFGFLVMREFRDPAVSPVIATLGTGTPDGNLIKWEKVANQTRLYNAVDITGESTNQTPVFYRAENHDPSSPTSIENLGRRKVYEYKSSFIETAAQAKTVGDSFLAVHGLESFTINWESLVLFWLEASDIVDFVDPSPSLGDPTRFLLGDFTFPLNLGTMSSTGRRVQVVS